MLVQQLINGLMLGSLYALTAIGLTLVVGLLGRLNLAHGDMFMAAAYGGLAATSFSVNPLVIVACAALVGMTLGYMVERVCFRPLRHASFLSPMLSTIAFGLLLQNLATQFWGSDPVRFTLHPKYTQPFDFGTLFVTPLQVLVLFIGIVLMVVIDYLVNHTSTGRLLRATNEDDEVAAQMGIDTRRIIVMTFVVSGLLAGISGALTAMVFSQFTPAFGIRQGAIAMVAMVLGGLGSLRGAMMGGLLIGLVEVLNDAYFNASYRDLVVFGLFFVVLVVRPNGLLQQRSFARD